MWEMLSTVVSRALCCVLLPRPHVVSGAHDRGVLSAYPRLEVAMSLALKLKVRSVPVKAYASLAHMVTFLSTCQFIDAYVVFLLLAFLNIGWHVLDRPPPVLRLFA